MVVNANAFAPRSLTDCVRGAVFVRTPRLCSTSATLQEVGRFALHLIVKAVISGLPRRAALGAFDAHRAVRLRLEAHTAAGERFIECILRRLKRTASEATAQRAAPSLNVCYCLLCPSHSSEFVQALGKFSLSIGNSHTSMRARP